ncbi:hypothetical protein HPG69_009678 [Diceros bicornis minor]|uniref:Uncharacterized protein n=1 Tax=Diceros bicornis minor TaxID=77932 RepID=A0A7J7EXR2_DICBM|nr:hypothetical protein HPG69_009678 [Diceros bicornis minor]
MAQDIKVDEEQVKDSIMQMRKLKLKKMKPQICQEKEEDVFGEPKASTRADTSILFIKGENKMAFHESKFKDLNGNVFQDAIFNQTQLLEFRNQKNSIWKIEIEASNQSDANVNSFLTKL